MKKFLVMAKQTTKPSIEPAIEPVVIAANNRAQSDYDKEVEERRNRRNIRAFGKIQEGTVRFEISNCTACSIAVFDGTLNIRDGDKDTVLLKDEQLQLNDREDRFGALPLLAFRGTTTRSKYAVVYELKE